jgi:hypothetical protein
MKAAWQIVGFFLVAALVGITIWQGHEHEEANRQEILKLQTQLDRLKGELEDPAFQQHLKDREAEAARLIEEAREMEAETKRLRSTEEIRETRDLERDK